MRFTDPAQAWSGVGKTAFFALFSGILFALSVAFMQAYKVAIHLSLL
jgi:hypothetical protein